MFKFITGGVEGSQSPLGVGSIMFGNYKGYKERFTEKNSFIKQVWKCLHTEVAVLTLKCDFNFWLV